MYSTIMIQTLFAWTDSRLLQLQLAFETGSSSTSTLGSLVMTFSPHPIFTSSDPPHLIFRKNVFRCPSYVSRFRISHFPL